MIRDVGLESIHVPVENLDVLRGTAYAYLRRGIPIYLMVGLFEGPAAGPFEPFYEHAVAVTGYELDRSRTVAGPTVKTNWPLRANRISRLLVHDDQVGPFSPMSFSRTDGKLTTEWRHPGKPGYTVVAAPRDLLIPVYHKIRIPYGLVYRAVGHFHGLLEWMKDAYPPALPNVYEWDIYLTTSRAFKKDLLADKRPLPAAERRKILLRNLPRFLWRATLRSDDRPVLDLIFDATDVEQGNFFLHPVGLSPALAARLSAAAGQPFVYESTGGNRRGKSSAGSWNWTKQANKRTKIGPQVDGSDRIPHAFTHPR